MRPYTEAANPVGAFFFYNRTRRGVATAPFGILSGVRTAFTPFLDRDLYSFLASLPAEMLWDHAFHTETICRAYPEMVAIPFPEKSQPARGGRIRRQISYRKIGWDLMKVLPHGSSRAFRRGWLCRQAMRAVLTGWPWIQNYAQLGLLLDCLVDD
jgi:hypothetical protein